MSEEYVRLTPEDLAKYREATAELDAAKFTAHIDGGRGYVRAHAAYWRLWEEIYDRYDLPNDRQFTIGMIKGTVRVVKLEEAATEPLSRSEH